MVQKAREKIFLSKLFKCYSKPNLKNYPSIEEIISVTLSYTLIRITKVNRIDRSVLYQEFKEWIINSGKNEHSQKILYLRY